MDQTELNLFLAHTSKVDRRVPRYELLQTHELDSQAGGVRKRRVLSKVPTG